jgi:hypothetical protein
VLAITADRITYGALGTTQAHAALITPQTRIYPGTGGALLAAISVGMQVDVETTDGIHAEAIRAGGDRDN